MWRELVGGLKVKRGDSRDLHVLIHESGGRAIQGTCGHFPRHKTIRWIASVLFCGYNPRRPPVTRTILHIRIKYVICTRIVRIFSSSLGASIGVVILSLNGKDGALRVKGARELSIGHCREHPPAAYAFIRQSSARSEPNASAAGPSV